MSKPVLHNVEIFDATKDKTFQFNWVATTLTQCKLEIYNSATDVKVYSGIQDIVNKKYIYTLPANSIVNEASYYAKVIVYDIHGNESTPSNIVQFRCELSPDFELNIQDNLVINATALEVGINFMHDTDTIKTLQFHLADIDKNIITESSEIIYETEEDLTYKFVGLNTHANYKVYASCVTTSGFELETKVVNVTTNCESLEFGGKYYVQKDVNGEYITCSTDFVIVQYNGQKEFTFNDSKIDLRNNNVMYYDEGFKLEGNFRIALKGMNFQCGQLLTVSNGVGEFTVSLNHYDDSTVSGYKLKLLAKYGQLKYLIYSDRFDLTANTLYTFWITKENGIYDMEIIKG